jgi:hypothetical protein
LYIRLSDLLVSPDDMGPSDSGNDGPPITVGGVDYKLCIMVFGNMFASQVDDTLNAGSPPIIFGSLPLRSVYFAADMSTRSVGFANKFDISFINAMYSTSKCQAAATCIGQQNYNPVTNLCNAPTCDDYFFAYLDETTQNCYNRLDLYNAGLTIIWLCIIMETVSFFVMQYSGLQVMGIENDDFRYTRVMNTQVDSFTYHVGKGMSHVLDLVSEFINDYTTVPP